MIQESRSRILLVCNWASFLMGHSGRQYRRCLRFIPPPPRKKGTRCGICPSTVSVMARNQLQRITFVLVCMPMHRGERKLRYKVHQTLDIPTWFPKLVFPPHPEECAVTYSFIQAGTDTITSFSGTESYQFYLSRSCLFFPSALGTLLQTLIIFPMLTCISLLTSLSTSHIHLPAFFLPDVNVPKQANNNETSKHTSDLVFSLLKIINDCPG